MKGILVIVQFYAIMLWSRDAILLPKMNDRIYLEQFRNLKDSFGTSKVQGAVTGIGPKLKGVLIISFFFFQN